MLASGVTLGGAVVAGLRSILTDGPGVAGGISRAAYWCWSTLTPWGRVEASQHASLSSRVAALEERQSVADRERGALISDLEWTPPADAPTPADARADLVRAISDLLAESGGGNG